MKLKQLLKNGLASAGFSLGRIPEGVPSGHDLARDLRLVVGGNDGVVCIDAGAHHGEFTSLLLRALNRPVIHAFEPAAEAFEALSLHHRRSPGVTLNHAALSDKAGTLELQTFDNTTLNSFLPLSEKGGGQLGEPRGTGIQTAPATDLVSYAAHNHLAHIQLLKIDTQGYELHVLRGAEPLLAAGRVDSVLAELNFAPLYAGQAAAHEVIAFLDRHGLQLVEFYEKCHRPPHLAWCTALFTRRSPNP